MICIRSPKKQIVTVFLMGLGHVATRMQGQVGPLIRDFRKLAVGVLRDSKKVIPKLAFSEVSQELHPLLYFYTHMP